MAHSCRGDRTAELKMLLFFFPVTFTRQCDLGFGGSQARPRKFGVFIHLHKWIEEFNRPSSWLQERNSSWCCTRGWLDVVSVDEELIGMMRISLYAYLSVYFFIYILIQTHTYIHVYIHKHRYVLLCMYICIRVGRNEGVYEY